MFVNELAVPADTGAVFHMLFAVGVRVRDGVGVKFDEWSDPKGPERRGDGERDGPGT